MCVCVCVCVCVSECLFFFERRLVADGHVFSLTVCGLTRIYLQPVPVPVLFLLVLGFGRFASSACVCVCEGKYCNHFPELHIAASINRPKDV